MVVKDTTKNKEEGNEEESLRKSDDESGEQTRESDHRNCIEERLSERLENGKLREEKDGDDEADPVDLIRLVA